MPSVNIGCRVPPEWRDRLEAIALAEGCDISTVVRGLVADRLGIESGDRLSQLERRVSLLEGRLRRLGDA